MIVWICILNKSLKITWFFLIDDSSGWVKCWGFEWCWLVVASIIDAGLPRWRCGYLLWLTVVVQVTQAFEGLDQWVVIYKLSPYYLQPRSKPNLVCHKILNPSISVNTKLQNYISTVLNYTTSSCWLHLSPKCSLHCWCLGIVFITCTIWTQQCLSGIPTVVHMIICRYSPPC